MVFSLTTAQAYAQISEIETWVQSYLTKGEWANPGLADGLRLQQRWWLGPLEVRLSDLVRVCGPEPEMEYRMSHAGWEQRVTAIQTSLTDVAALPPLIITEQAGALKIRDGNHRHEAMRRKGWERCWVLVWFNEESDLKQHFLYRLTKS